MSLRLSNWLIRIPATAGALILVAHARDWAWWWFLLAVVAFWLVLGVFWMERPLWFERKR